MARPLGRHGWEDLWSYPNTAATLGAFAGVDIPAVGTPKVAGGTVITMQVTDDTQPGGPRTVERRFVAPFARASREADYRLVWAFFGSEAASGEAQ